MVPECNCKKFSAEQIPELITLSYEFGDWLDKQDGSDCYEIERMLSNNCPIDKEANGMEPEGFEGGHNVVDDERRHPTVRMMSMSTLHWGRQDQLSDATGRGQILPFRGD